MYDAVQERRRGTDRARVVRPRLSALLDTVSDRRVVEVLGDAASGKTAAVEDWVVTLTEPQAYVPVLPGRDEPRHLLTALVAATEDRCPGLRPALAPELDARAAGARADDPHELAAATAGVLAAGWAERATGPFTVVLDDAHELQDTAGLAFVTELVRLAPRPVRWLVVARSRPALALHRVQDAGEYAEVGPWALRFTPAETAALFDAAGLTLDDGDARAVTDACGGWAGGLRLALESALARGVPQLVDHLGSSAAPAYLATVALQPLDELGRRLVTELAVLGRLDRAALAGRPADTARLDELAERGLLVATEPDGWTLTALARYAVDHAVPVSADNADTIRRDAVHDALAAGREAAALEHATATGDADLVRATLTAAARALLDGTGAPLDAAAGLVGCPAGDPDADGLLACWFATRGEPARALAHLDGATRDGRLPASVGWRVATALWAHGAAADAERVLARTDETAGAPRPADLAQLEAARATLAWGRGDGSAARRHADLALERARACGDDATLGAAWVSQALVAALEGDLQRNRSCYATALTHALAGHDVLTQLRVRCNVGSRLTEIGRYQEALTELEDAVRLGEATGQRTRIALARLNQGQARAGLGRLDEGLADIDAALTIWTDLGSPMATWAQQARADVLARRGDRSRAAEAYRGAIAAAEQQQDAQTLVPALAGLARCQASDDPAAAADTARRALDQPAALGSVVALLAAGWLALQSGDRDAGARYARQARDEAARREDPASLAQALVLGVLSHPSPSPSDAALSEARALLEDVGDPVGVAELDAVVATLAGDHSADERARARLRALGVRDSAALVAGPLAVLRDRRRAAVTIRTLGAFAVLRGDDVVPASAWQSRKARDLLKILAARRGRPITREALADLLWPDERDAAGNRLSVALSTVRAVLDPDKAMPADHAVVADRAAVRLSASVAVDLERYHTLAGAAVAAAEAGAPDAVGLLQRAAAAYSGDFCEEDPDEAWAAPTRDELRATHQQVLRSLADALVADGRADAAVPWLLALIGLDPYDEPGHLRLVETLGAAGRHGDARRSYRAYADRMAELDVEPAPFPQPVRRHARSA